VAAACEEIEKNRKKGKDSLDERRICIRVWRGWISHTVSKTAQRPRETQAVFSQEYCVSHQVKLPSVFSPPMWLRLSSGMSITTERVRTRLGHGTKIAPLNDPRCPALDLTGTCPSSLKAFCPPHRIPIERTIFIFGLKWPDRVTVS
jgi:hypothetical protein